jgi:uncharacterized protein YbaA (DUF1428 family)
MLRVFKLSRHLPLKLLPDTTRKKEIPLHYIDGFVAAVPTENKEKYIQHAALVAPLFREYGALKIVECWGDDVPEGKLTSFPMAVKKEEHETVVFSWVVWPSREDRDGGWRKLMADPRMTAGANPPFDGKRLIYGGFQTILDL